MNEERMACGGEVQAHGFKVAPIVLHRILRGTMPHALPPHELFSAIECPGAVGTSR